MATLLTTRARAWVYSGAWVADCPAACGNVEALGPPGGGYHCGYCGRLADVEWPDAAADIMAVLSLRPIPHTRNWFPPSHDLALRAGLPHGQSVVELLDENAEHGVTV